MTSMSADQTKKSRPEDRTRDPKDPPPGARSALSQPWWILLLGFVLVNISVRQIFFPEPPSVTVPYTWFKKQVAAGNVVSVTSIRNTIRGELRSGIAYAPGAAPAKDVETTATPSATVAAEANTPTRFRTERPAFAEPGLEALLESNNVIVEALDENSSSMWNLLLGFGPTLLMIAAFVWLARTASAAGGGLFGLGRSRAKRYGEEDLKVTFEDVAGIDEAEHELVEIVDFLKNPDKYQRLGGTVPKGVLLVGAPGTGKTLLAKAVAGQAGVPFFSMSASEFIEMIVGVGASRVRDLFRQAREAAPAIIFIDELDAIGRTRGGSSPMGGQDEREQTLNQILTEMDGFDSREGVIVLAATNRADVLDQALLRPGRFDRRVVVQRPDRNGRAAILRVHTRKVPLDTDVSLENLAAETPGLVGAELRNLVNEAALLAAGKGATAVGAAHFAEALQKITLGPARHILLQPGDRERTAYHEAGHALVGLLVPGSDPVHRVSIVPRGLSLGATWQLPVDDRTSYAEDYLRARITGALGGRAAEKLVYGVTTTGAENDLQQVTDIARLMVLRWGMSEKLGPISFVVPQDEGLPPAFQQQPYSEATAVLIDAEVRRIVEDSHREAGRLLAAHRDRLDALARALLQAESLDAAEILEATGLPAQPVDPTTNDLLSASGLPRARR
jgi:cell division protease FtsH